MTHLHLICIPEESGSEEDTSVSLGNLPNLAELDLIYMSPYNSKVTCCICLLKLLYARTFIYKSRSWRTFKHGHVLQLTLESYSLTSFMLDISFMICIFTALIPWSWDHAQWYWMTAVWLLYIIGMVNTPCILCQWTNSSRNNHQTEREDTCCTRASPWVVDSCMLANNYSHVVHWILSLYVACCSFEPCQCRKWNLCVL